MQFPHTVTRATLASSARRLAPLLAPVLALILATACSTAASTDAPDAASPGPDGSAPADASGAVDAARQDANPSTPDAGAPAPDAGSSMPDAASPSDATAAPDAMLAPDATVTPDAVAAPDAAPPADAGTGPLITAVDYPVIAHGSRLVLTGTNLDGVTEVTIGGVSHANLSNVSATSVTVDSILDAAPVGTGQPVIVKTAAGDSAAFEVTVIHLIINELDPDSPGADDQEFVELDIGFAGSVSLDGYVLVFFNGAATGTPSIQGRVYGIYDLDGSGATTTASSGLFLVGAAALSVTPQINLTTAIQQGEDAVAVYQFAGATSAFAEDYASAGNTGLIDAVIYESNDDTDRATIRPLLIDDTVIDEGATTAAREMVTIQRCPSDVTRRKGASYRLDVATPGAVNSGCGS